MASWLRGFEPRSEGMSVLVGEWMHRRMLTLTAVEARVRELVRYLLRNAVIDFEGEITMENVREILRREDSRESRALLSKLANEKGLEEFLITIADCLKDHIPTGISEQVLREQMSVYSES